ncbi:hypothetical protein GLOTRDRAFT_131940 [Gloeophyllum trabeum ATCC 11539]|uniref:DUF6534 domain-containing protein n=1 Tax=Gloeophyllum trabeum (strain ATCC 11539 / FP-39264 / Madison 617) TaxID=670483 RepID=S7PZ03_GLOTA|nr:uncharacterized protein GLOTRDRAFT_131940 [Gloeophyllum trabeum ATCC 11539]EPQ52703.1 hypothetical protein GLOTRDRAFT_131940 [Gloeophyllum trabeum ATCC 11539]
MALVGGQNKPLTAGVALLATMRFCFGTAVAALCYYIPHWSTFRAHEYADVMVSLALGSATGVDVLSAVSLIWYLQKRPTSKLEDSRINYLTVYILNTGLITSVFSLLILVTVLPVPFVFDFTIYYPPLQFVALKSNLVFLAFVEIQSRLYANSFLASLNARKALRNQGVSVQFSTYDFGVGSGSPTARIRVVKETIKTVDEPLGDPGRVVRESLSFTSSATEDNTLEGNEKRPQFKVSLSSQI